MTGSASTPTISRQSGPGGPECAPHVTELIRALPAPRPIPWKFVLLASYVGVNLVLIPTKIVLGPDVGADWLLFRQLPHAINDGTIYEIGRPTVWFVWSPVAAWLMAGVAVLGYWAWAALHVASVLLLRRPLLIGLVLISYAFWFDVAQGNTATFVFVAGALALAGSRGASLVYLGLFLLMPRPLMAPIAVWLLWKDRSLWRPFAAIFVIHAAMVLASGDAWPWISSLLVYDLAPGITIGPTAWIGRWWLLAGIPLAAWLTWRRHFGWASLAASPYITPQYLLFVLWEVAPRDQEVDYGPRRSGVTRAAAANSRDP